MLMTCGLCIIGSNGPKTGTLRAARNSSAAFFCSSVYCSGGIVGSRCCARAGAEASMMPANRTRGGVNRNMICSFCEDRQRVGTRWRSVRPRYIAAYAHDFIEVGRRWGGQDQPSLALVLPLV